MSDRRSQEPAGPKLNPAARIVATALAAAWLVGCSGGATGDESTAEPANGFGTPATRPAPRDAELVAASHILIQYEGVRGAPEGLARTKDEALELARGIADRAQAGEDFAELARNHSEGPSSGRGGDVGVIPRAGGIPAEFYDAVLALDYEAISDPVESAFGIHVIRRNDVEIAAARHILVSYTGAARASESIERTREQALERCAEILAELQAGADFEELAQEQSDGPSSVKGGDLGLFPRGRMDKTFDDAVFALEVGATSDVVETPFGCHVILRYE